jgi:hypothetical protein
MKRIMQNTMTTPVYAIEDHHIIYIQLTIYLDFLWGIGMEDIEWSNKITEINDSLVLNIKHVKNLRAKLFEC